METTIFNDIWSRVLHDRKKNNKKMKLKTAFWEIKEQERIHDKIIKLTLVYAIMATITTIILIKQKKPTTALFPITQILLTILIHRSHKKYTQKLITLKKEKQNKK